MTHIYTSVVVDGTSTGNCPVGCDCAGIQHYASVENTLGSTGGWITGSRVPWNGYVDTENDQSIQATYNTTYDFVSDGRVTCTAAGVLYDAASILNYVNLKRTVGQNTLGSTVVSPNRLCGMTPACTNTTSPACGAPSFTYQCPESESCPGYVFSAFVAVRLSTSSPWTCSLVGSTVTTGPGTCDLL